MMNISKVALATIFCTSLSGCFEVDDKGNDEIAAALAAQNAILQGQIDAENAEKYPITLFGSITNLSSAEDVSDAIIRVKVGAEWREPVAATAEFTIEELPVSTDFLIVVSSESGAFLERVFYGQTISVDAGQVASQSIGDLRVSAGTSYSFAVLDAEDSEPVEGLVFQYSLVSAVTDTSNTTNVDDYIVQSTYDDQTGRYTIVTPLDLSALITASRDIDGDGIVDFESGDEFYDYGDDVLITSSELLSIETFYVEKTPVYQPVEFRISLINELGESIPEIEFFENDTFSGILNTSYDVDSEEYVFNYESSSSITINMPSFEFNDVTYNSGLIRLTWDTSESLRVSDSGFDNNLPNNIDLVDGIASVIMLPRISSSQSNSVSLVSSVLDEDDNYSLKQFYQSPIGLVADSATLTKLDVFKVIKGNESTEDLVPAGTTVIGETSEPIAVSATLTRNDTFLTVSADSDLTNGEYRYELNTLVNSNTGFEFESNFSNFFDIEELPSTAGVFDINDIRVDNNNHTTNGTAIVLTNTAGVASTPTDNRSNTRLYLPKSIESLDFLEITTVSYTRDGAVVSYVRDQTIVDEDGVKVSTRQLVSLAENENVEDFFGRTAQADTGAAVADGEWYFTGNLGAYLSDNTPTDVNDITFSYLYRVAGETTVYEGTITVPAL